MVSCIENDGFLDSYEKRGSEHDRGWFWPDAAEKKREKQVRPGSKKDGKWGRGGNSVIRCAYLLKSNTYSGQIIPECKKHELIRQFPNLLAICSTKLTLFRCKRFFYVSKTFLSRFNQRFLYVSANVSFTFQLTFLLRF